ncbi:MAG: hypothetical protein M9897_09160 [Brumimicrobium sp.]|nr:hypothetical protein [Brumimicrobium sp.]
MKNIFFCTVLCFSLFFSCTTDKDFWSTYSFNIKNDTQDTISIKFLKELNYDNSFNDNDIINWQEVVLYPEEKKDVRTFKLGGINPNDHLKTSFDNMFSELIFNTYINGIKLEKDLWQPDNWVYQKISDREAEYKMTITDDMIGE